MKLCFAFLLIGLCAISANGAKKPRSSVEENVKKMQEFYKYIRSEEFAKIVKDFEDRILVAPESAVTCFRNSFQGAEEDKQDAIRRIRRALQIGSPEEMEYDENLLQRLRRIAEGVMKVLTDKELGHDLLNIDEKFDQSMAEAVKCYEQELQSIFDDIMKTVHDVEKRFFGTEL